MTTGPIKTLGLRDSQGLSSKDSGDNPRMSILPPAKPKPGLIERIGLRAIDALESVGEYAIMAARSLPQIFKRPFEFRAIIYQIEQQGIASLWLAGLTAMFLGMVMAIQFAFGLQKFGGMEYVGRVIGISFARELAPTLTAVIVGSRIAAGMAAEVGSMSVTEQVDAIRALGADPIKKLVMPRVIACIVVMPVLAFFALLLGFGGAVVVVSSQFGLSKGFMYHSALESVTLYDLTAGMFKTPFFGFLIATVGCHNGLRTRGGTEGVGNSTTSTVVTVSIAVLVLDFFLTKLFMGLFEKGL